MDYLQKFAVDRFTREAIEQYVFNYLDAQILEQAYIGKEVQHIVKAKEILKRALEKLVRENIGEVEKDLINENY